MGFDINGVVKVKRAINREDISILKKSANEIIDNNQNLSFNIDGTFKSYIDSRLTSKGIETFIKRMPLLDCVANLMGSKCLYLLYDQLFIKEPYEHASSNWHNDLAHWPVKTQKHANMWIPFQDITKESGGLELILGSHKWNRLLKWQANENFDSYESKYFEMESGDVLIFSGLIIHRSKENNTEQRRDALSIRFVGDGTTYCSNIGEDILVNDNTKLQKIL